MAIRELINESVANLKKLNIKDEQSDEFKSLSEKILKALFIASVNSNADINERLLITSFRFYCINHINFLTQMKIQRKFNRNLTRKLKETGTDVTNLDKYLDIQIKPYFPDFG